MLLYAKVNSLTDIPTLAGAIKGAFSNAYNMTANMDQGSNIMYIYSPGGYADITDFTGLPDITTGFFNFIGTGYNQYVMKDILLTLDSTTDSNLDSGTYSNIQFLQSSVTVNAGINVAGTQSNQFAIAQKNAIGGTVSGF